MGGGADYAAVAVLVVAGDRAELVFGELVGLLVVGVGLSGRGAAWERGELEQRGWGGGAVEVAVVAGRAVVGAVGAAVVGVKIDDQLGAELAEGEREGVWLAVGVAGVGEQVILSDRVEVRLQGEQQSHVETSPPLQPPNDDPIHYLAGIIRGEVHDENGLSSLKTNLVVTEILDAARRAANEGRTITLPLEP